MRPPQVGPETGRRRGDGSPTASMGRPCEGISLLRALGRGQDLVHILRGHEDEPRVAHHREWVLHPVVHVQVADDVVVEGVQVEHGEEVHRLVLLHVDHLDRAVLDGVQEVPARFVRGDDDLAGLASLLHRAHDARAGLRVEAHHARQVGVADEDRRRIGRDLLHVGARLLVGHHHHAWACGGERIAQSLAGRDEVRCRQERDGADLAFGQAAIGVVPALVLAVLIAQVVPVRAEV